MKERKASDLKLLKIGKRSYKKLSRSQTREWQHQNDQNILFDDQEYPKESNKSQDAIKLSENQSRYSAIEDTRISRFSHHKILMVQKNMLMLSILIIFFGMLKADADNAYPGETGISNSLMNVMSFTTCVLVILVVIRKILILQLQIDQRQVYICKKDRKQCRSSLWAVLRDPVLFVELITEIVLILPHPMSFLEGCLYTSYNENFQIELLYSYNDLLSVLMMIKTYVVFRSLIALTKYCSPRAIRLCQNNSIQHNLLFSLKCLQQEYPLLSSATLFLVFMFIFGFGFRVTEGNVHYLNEHVFSRDTGFDQYINCYWFAFITMMTVGDGDYYPITALGKLLAVLIAIIGVILNSFLVVSLSEYIKMKSAQFRSHTTLYRLNEQQIYRKQATGALTDTIKIIKVVSKQNLDPLIMKSLKPVFEGLKRKIDKTKACGKKIKSILPQENKTELMLRQFEIVKDNFRQLYLKQRKIKEKIVTIETLKQPGLKNVRQSFLNEVNGMLSKYHC